MAKNVFITIAIDGGAASGKSSTSRALAAHFHLLHVDTGAHYRGVTFACLQAGVASEEGEALETFLEKVRIGVAVDGQSARMTVNGLPPEEDAIRSPEVNAAVSKFAAIPAVRQFLFAYQRRHTETARDGKFAGVIMEGRDIGSVIFPDADVKIFLEADPETRAARRVKEGRVDAIAERDKLDQSRKTAPMVCPEGAIRIDTAPFTLDEVVARCIEIVEQTQS